MSPLWRDEVGIYLAQRRLCLVRIRRGIKPTLAREEDQVEPLAAPGWENVLALLESQLAQGEWSDARARVVIADQWVRYTVVPWSDALSSAAERLAHARELMAGVFGEAMSDWTVSLSEAPPGASRLASAMPTALLESATRIDRPSRPETCLRAASVDRRIQQLAPCSALGRCGLVRYGRTGFVGGASHVRRRDRPGACGAHRP